MFYGVCIPTDLTDSQIPRGVAVLGPARGRVNRLQIGARARTFAESARTAESARARVTPEDASLQLIGYWDAAEGQLRLLPGRARQLSSWIGRAVHRGEIEASDSQANERAQARRDFRRAVIQGNGARAAQIANRHHLRGW